MTLALLLTVPLLACVLSAVARRRAVLEAVNVAAFALTFLLAVKFSARAAFPCGMGSFMPMR